MAITHAATTTYTSSSDLTTHTITGISVLSGANRILAVGVGLEGDGTTPSVSAVTFDAGGADEASFTAGPNIASGAGGFDNVASLWYLLEANIPASGTYTVDVVLSSSTARVGAACTQLDDCKQTTVPEASNTNNCTSCTSLSASITTTTDGAWIIDVYANSGHTPTITVDSGQTERWNVVSSSQVRAYGSTKPVATAGATSTGVTLSASSPRVVMANMALAPESGSSVTANPTTVAGTGSLGTVTAIGDANALPTTVVGTSAAGDPSITGDATFSVTGVAATGAPGTPSVDIGITGFPTGVAGTGASGSPTIVTGSTLTPVAVEGTGAIGSVAVFLPDVTATPTTAAGTGEVGDPTILFDKTITPPSVIGTTGAGTPSVAIDGWVEVDPTETTWTEV